MSTLDLRGFDYRLGPLLLRQRWRVEAEQMKLARLHETIGRYRDEHDMREQHRRQLCAQALQGASGGGDLAACRRTLLYLAGLWQRKIDGERMLALLEEQKKALAKRCQDLQRRLELLEQHKADQLAAYRVELQRRHDGDMDREWLARRAWREARSMSITDHEEERA